MTSPIVRKKNQAKHAAWENMTNEELVSMLGKRGRGKTIRAILRKRIQAMILLLPAEERIPIPDARKNSLPLYDKLY